MSESIGELRRICQGADPNDRKFPMVLLRKVSIYFTKLLLFTSITANQVTILGALIGVVGGTMLAFGNWYTFTGALLLHLHLIFDCVDGEVARYRNAESLTGTYLDLLCHHIVNPLVFMGISFNVYSVFQDPKVFIFAYSAILSRMLMSIAGRCKVAAVFSKYLRAHNRSEENANKRQLEGHSKEDKIPPPSNLDEKTYFASRSKVLYKMSQIIYVLHGQTMRNNFILLASLIDMAIPLMMIGPLKLNLMYILLIFYGTFSHLLWSALVFLTVKTKSVDRLYSVLSKQGAIY